MEPSAGLTTRLLPLGRILVRGHVQLSAVISIASFFVIWWAVVAAGLVTPEVLPSPFAIFPAAAELLKSGELQIDFLVSLLRIAGGFLLACVLGIVLGLLMGIDERIEDIFQPLVDLIRQIPAVAWIPLSIIWFGFGEGTRIFIVFMGAFAPIVINTTDGVRGVDPHVLNAAQSLGAKKNAIFWKISLPAALPAIFTGMAVGLGSAFANIIAAELAGATTGLGYMMLMARESFRTDIVILGMVVLMAIGLGLMGVVLGARRVLLDWAYEPSDA